MRAVVLWFAAVLVGFGAGFGGARQAHAQDADSFGETLEQVGEAYVESYTQPVVDAVGANLNSGFFHQSGVGGGLLESVDLYLGVKAFASPVPASDRSLDLTYTAPESITLPDGTQCTSLGDVTYEIEDAPTAFGPTETGEIYVEDVSFRCDDGTTLTEDVSMDLLPGFLDTDVAPLALPQAGVGIRATGTHLSLRFLPRLRYRDYGTIAFVGGGVRQDLEPFLPVAPPLDLAVHLFYQSISLEEEIQRTEGTEFVSASTFAAGLSASKTLSVFTFYGGLQFERMDANFNYTFVPGVDLDPQTVDLDLSGANSFRALAGLSAGLGPVVLSVDYSQGQRSVLSTGLGFQF